MNYVTEITRLICYCGMIIEYFNIYVVLCMEFRYFCYKQLQYNIIIGSIFMLILLLLLPITKFIYFIFSYQNIKCILLYIVV